MEEWNLDLSIAKRLYLIWLCLSPNSIPYLCSCCFLLFQDPRAPLSQVIESLSGKLKLLIFKTLSQSPYQWDIPDSLTLNLSQHPWPPFVNGCQIHHCYIFLCRSLPSIFQCPMLFWKAIHLLLYYLYLYLYLSITIHVPRKLGLWGACSSSLLHQNAQCLRHAVNICCRNEWTIAINRYKNDKDIKPCKNRVWHY